MFTPCELRGDGSAIPARRGARTNDRWTHAANAFDRCALDTDGADIGAARERPGRTRAHGRSRRARRSARSRSPHAGALTLLIIVVQRRRRLTATARSATSTALLLAADPGRIRRPFPSAGWTDMCGSAVAPTREARRARARRRRRARCSENARRGDERYASPKRRSRPGTRRRGRTAKRCARIPIARARLPSSHPPPPAAASAATPAVSAGCPSASNAGARRKAVLARTLRRASAGAGHADAAPAPGRIQPNGMRSTSAVDRARDAAIRPRRRARRTPSTTRRFAATSALGWAPAQC